MITLLLVAILTIDSFNAYYYKAPYLRDGVKEENAFNLSTSFFPHLRNYRVRGTVAYEANYPWIASVVHSVNKTVPYLCTAVCIDENIFISAARCVYKLKVAFTSVMYNHQRLRVKALVMPSHWSKQLYDNIGFIVTTGAVKKWQTIPPIEKERTDHSFKWFNELKFEEFDNKVVGYAFTKSLENIPIWLRTIDLVELDVAVGLDLCHKILSYNNLINAFEVPCYHSCTFAMFEAGNELCKKYHGVEGGALINKRSNILLGIATWGAYFKDYELPVGFSVPNSHSFQNDYECAQKIRNYTGMAGMGTYPALCSDSPESWSRAEEDSKDDGVQ